MNATALLDLKRTAANPISLGLKCWFWERERIRRMLFALGERLGVTLKVSHRVHGLRCYLQFQVTGQNVDRFIGEFARFC
jgi:hypothetical protein